MDEWKPLGIGDMKNEVSRMKRSAKQSLDKERAMLDQLNTLRRARDASETRVQAWGVLRTNTPPALNLRLPLRGSVRGFTLKVTHASISLRVLGDTVAKLEVQCYPDIYGHLTKYRCIDMVS